VKMPVAELQPDKPVLSANKRGILIVKWTQPGNASNYATKNVLRLERFDIKLGEIGPEEVSLPKLSNQEYGPTRIVVSDNNSGCVEQKESGEWTCKVAVVLKRNTTRSSIFHQKYWIRVQALYSTTGDASSLEWSQDSEPTDDWAVTGDCAYNEYLFVASENLADKKGRGWGCKRCPEDDGVDCRGDVTHRDLKINPGFSAVEWHWNPVVLNTDKSCGTCNPKPDEGWCDHSGEMTCIDWVKIQPDLGVLPCPKKSACPGGDLISDIEKCPCGNATASCLYNAKWNCKTCEYGYTGALCQTCIPGFEKMFGTCQECNPLRTSIQFGILCAIIVLIVAIYCCYLRWRKTHSINLSEEQKKRLGELLASMLRITKINLDFFQVHTAATSVIKVEWPQAFTDFCDAIDIINFDFLQVTGATCLGGINFNHRFFATSMLPLLACLFGIRTFCRGKCSSKSRRELEAHSQEEQLRILGESAFLQADQNGDGKINAKELTLLFKDLGYAVTTKEALDIILRVNNTYNKRVKSASEEDEDARLVRHKSSTMLWSSVRKTLGMGIKKDQFVNLFCDPEFAKALYTVRQDQRKKREKKEIEKKTNNGRRGRRLSSAFALGKQRSLVTEDLKFDLNALHNWKYERELFRKSTNTAVVFLFLAHTPVSKKVFEFFNCDDLYGHFYMRADYSIECYVDYWWGFFPYVLIVGLGFTLGLPVAITFYLQRNRKRLQSHMVKEQIGFLYEDFNTGAEWWEVHEILRKSILTGCIIYVRNPLLQTSTALVVSILSLINLNYFHPHKESAIFWLDQIAFITTTLMFQAALLLSVGKESSGIENREGVGPFLIALNLFFFISSIVSTVISFRQICKGVKNLGRVLSKEIVTTKKKKTRRVSRGASSGAATSGGNDHPLPRANTTGPDEASPSLHQILPVHHGGLSRDTSIQKSASTVASDLQAEHSFHERKLAERRQLMRIKSVARTKSRLQARNLLKGTKVLEKISAFSGISSMARETIARTLRIRNFFKGKVICAEDDVAQQLYILLKGKVRVTKKQGARYFLTGEEMLLAEMQAPSYFGEIALLSATTPKRTASVTVASDMALLMIMHREEFDEFVATNVLNASALNSIRADMNERVRHTMSVLNHEEEAMRASAEVGRLELTGMSDFDFSQSVQSLPSEEDGEDHVNEVFTTERPHRTSANIALGMNQGGDSGKNDIGSLDLESASAVSATNKIDCPSLTEENVAALTKVSMRRISTSKTVDLSGDSDSNDDTEGVTSRVAGEGWVPGGPLEATLPPAKEKKRKEKEGKEEKVDTDAAANAAAATAANAAAATAVAAATATRIVAAAVRVVENSDSDDY
jgi:CRP-like cAMP-binding protein